MHVSAKHLHEVAQPVYTVDVCITHQHDVLMFKRSDTKKVFPGWLALPGGHIEEGETPLAAAVREVSEEVGITLSPEHVQLKFVAMHHHRDRNELFVVFGFLAVLTAKPVRVISNHEGSAAWIHKDALATMDTIFPPVKYYLPHVLSTNPGILYNYSIWDHSKLVRVVSEQTDANS